MRNVLASVVDAAKLVLAFGGLVVILVRLIVSDLLSIGD